MGCWLTLVYLGDKTGRIKVNRYLAPSYSQSTALFDYGVFDGHDDCTILGGVRPRIALHGLLKFFSFDSGFSALVLADETIEFL